MSEPTPRRAHLIERAAEALGGINSPTAVLVEAPRRPAAAERAAPPMPEAAPAPLLITRAVLAAAGLMAAADGPLRSRIVEEMTLVQQQVLRTIREAPPGTAPHNRIVLVTSARPHEGKSFTALNLAASMAISGARQVLLIDADGRLGGMSNTLGVLGQPGLRALAHGRNRHPAPLLHPTALEGLRFLPYGVCPPGDPLLPPGADMAAAVLRVAVALPDHILVLDTPPTLSTSDPSVLAAISGQVVLVVNAEQTQRNEVEAALDMLDASPVLQLLLNRVRLTANDTFGAYGDYGTPHDA